MGVAAIDSTMHDAGVRIRESEPALLELLYVHYAWRLRTRASVPELDPAPERGTSAIPPSRSKEAWSALWDVSWASVRGLGGGVARSWTDVGGWVGLDEEACRAWTASLPRADGDALELPVADALAAARGRGLRLVHVLPYQGSFVQQDDESSLTISWSTRADAEQYASALGSFLDER